MTKVSDLIKKKETTDNSGGVKVSDLIKPSQEDAAPSQPSSEQPNQPEQSEINLDYFISQAPQATDTSGLDDPTSDLSQAEKKEKEETIIEARDATTAGKYKANGQEIERSELKNKLYHDDEFIKGIQNGTINISVQDDPELMNLLQRQVESGGELGDKWESLKAGAASLASGVIGIQPYISEVMENATGIPFTVNPINIGNREAAKDLVSYANKQREKIRAYEEDFLGSVISLNLSEAAQIGLNASFESIPNMALAAGTGGGSRIAQIGRSFAVLEPISVGRVFAETKEAEGRGESLPLSEGEKRIRELVFGTAEAGGEAVSTALFAKNIGYAKDLAKGLVGKAARVNGTEAAEEVAEKMSVKLVGELAKGMGMESIQEGSAEGLTQLTQDLTDNLLGVSDLNGEQILRRTANAAALGSFMGTSMSGLGSTSRITSATLNSVRDNDTFNGMNESISDAEKSGEISSEEAQKVRDNLTETKEAVDKVDPTLSEEKQVEATELIKQRDELQNELDGREIVSQENQEKLNSLNEQIQNFGKPKEGIDETKTKEQPKQQPTDVQKSSPDSEQILEGEERGDGDIQEEAVKEPTDEELELTDSELAEISKNEESAKELEAINESISLTEQKISELEDVSGATEDVDENRIILENIGKVSPESAKKETGGRVGTRGDISLSWVKKGAPSIEAKADEIYESYFTETKPPDFVYEIRSRIIDFIQGSKKEQLEQYTKSQEIKDLKSEIRDFKKSRKNLLTKPKKTPVKEKIGKSTDIGQDAQGNDQVKETSKTKFKKIAKERAYDGEIRDEVKKKIKDIGLTREVESHKDAAEKADTFIDEVGLDFALSAVRSGDVKGAPAAHVFNKSIEDLDSQISKAKTQEEIEGLMTQQADLFNEFSEGGTSSGQFISYLNEIYQKSDLGYNVEKKISDFKKQNDGVIPPETEAKFRELDAELKDLKKQIKEAEAKEKQREEEDLIRNIIEAADRDSMPKQKRAYAKKAVKSIKDLRKKIKANNYSDATGMIAIIDSGLLTIEKSISAGIEIAEAIDKGVKYIKTKLKEKGIDTWEKESKFREDVKAHFKESGILKTEASIKDGKIHIPSGVLRGLIQSGFTTIDELTQEVYNSLKDTDSSITIREVRDAITGYGKTVNLNKDEVSKQLSKAKSIGRIISALEDIKNKIRPLKSGAQRDRLSSEERALKKQLREAMKTLPEDLEANERQLKTQLESDKQRLKNQIEDLEREIEKGEKVPRSSKVRKSDDELDALKKKRDEVKELHDSIFKNEEFREQRRLELAKRNTEKKIEDLKRRIRERDFSKRKKKPLISDSELTKLKAKALKIQSEYDKEFYRDELSKRTKRQKALDMVQEAWNFTRVMRATGEFSFMLIQGGIQTIAHPKHAAEALKRSLRFMASEKRTNEWLDEIKSQDWYPEMKESKLALTEIHAEITAREELFYSAWTDAAWNWATRPIKWTRGDAAYERAKELNPFKMVERAAVGYLDTMRVLRFLQGKELLEGKGITYNSNPKAYKEMADVINTFTGRASLGALEQISKPLTNIFFSPRNWASAIKTATPYALYHFGKMRAGAEGYKPSIAQKMALADFGKFVGATASFVMMAAVVLNNDDDDETGVEFDPTSSDFMKIKLGNIRIDPWGGKIQQITFIARMITGTVKKNGRDVKLGTPFKTPTRRDLALQQATNKLSPSAAMVNKYLSTHEDASGNLRTPWGEEFTWGGEVSENLKPIFVDTVKELADEDEDTLLKSMLVFMAFMGWGINIYGNKKSRKSKKKASLPKTARSI